MGISFDLKLAISGFDHFLKEACSNQVTDERVTASRFKLLDAAEKVARERKIEFRTRYFTFINAQGRTKTEIDKLNECLQQIRQKVEDSPERISDKIVQFHKCLLSFKAYVSLLVPQAELLEKVQKWSEKENYARLHDITLVPNSILDVIGSAKEYSSAIDMLRGRGNGPLKWLDSEKLEFNRKECKKSLQTESARTEELLEFMSEAQISQYVVEKVKKWAQKTHRNDIEMND
jgi:hypothetical protein